MSSNKMMNRKKDGESAIRKKLRFSNCMNSMRSTLIRAVKRTVN